MGSLFNINFDYITFDQIKSLNITPSECIQWAEYVIKHKRDMVLPPKTPIHFGNDSFFTSMPSMIPNLNIYGLKCVSRFQNRVPALKADISLYNAEKGDLICMLDGTWITTMRTGAVAAITAKALEKNGNSDYSFIGLGNTARATLICLDEILNHKEMTVKLLAYKKQHKQFTKRFEDYNNIHFEVYKDTDDFIRNSSVLFSCVTSTDSLFSDEENYPKGITLIPVHTKGFQNCDLVFDRIYCDDIPHISGFKNFKRYKEVVEMTDVLNNYTNDGEGGA